MNTDNSVCLDKRRILSIDGGGIRGTFPIAFLASIEEQLDRPIGEYFDLITGTSTGGIIALGLGLGLKASEILDLYERRGPEIFGQNLNPIQNFLVNKLRLIRWPFCSKYSSENLCSVLEELFGDKQIGHSKTRLVIPAWNSVRQKVYIYKTAHHQRFKTDYKSKVIDVALATSAAPTYFQQHLTEECVGLIDGGIWANNPTAVAVTEAIGILNWPANQLYVLSLGCLDEVYSLPKRAGLMPLASKLISLFMNGQSRGSMGIAKLLTGHEHQRNAIFRVNPPVTQGKYPMDDTSAILELKGLGFSEARERIPSLEPIFFSTPVATFQPVHPLS
jgi:hypothetical protein